MKKIFLITFALFFSIGALAQDKHLICLTGDAIDMDIKLENLGEKNEKVSVILMEMDGETTHTYLNSNVLNQSVSKNLEQGKFTALVSKSDLTQAYGGAYVDAGLLQMEYNREKSGFEVLFAAQGMVFQGLCRE